MPIAAKKPELKNKRLKMLMFGPAGIGKTTCAIQFKNSVILDLERGTDNYANTINASGSIVLQTIDLAEIKRELKALLTEKHNYSTVILDPVTILYQLVQDRWQKIFEKWSDSEKTSEMQDWGFRFWGKVKSEYKGLMRMLLALDCNVILIAHQKDIYGDGMKKVGLGSDSMRGDEYLLDYIFQLTVDSKGRRMAITRKERGELGANKFPPEFEWSYENFAKFYGKESLERQAIPVLLATTEQVTEIKRLLQVVKVEGTWEADCLEKAAVDDWAEMTAEKIQKAIDYLTKKLSGGK